MEEKTVPPQEPVHWLDELGFKSADSTSRKYQTTARFSQKVFRYLEQQAAENGTSVAEEIRKAVRQGLREGGTDE